MRAPPASRIWPTTPQALSPSPPVQVMPPAAPLRVDIGALTLPPMPRSQGARVAAAMQAELARLLAQPAAQVSLRERAQNQAMASMEVLNAGTLRLVHGERPERTGQRLAEQIARGLTGHTERRRP